jgi:hypothetical protein
MSRVTEVLDEIEQGRGIAVDLSLRYFPGLSLADASEVCGVSTATAYRQRGYARAWLSCELGEQRGAP